MLYYEIIRLDTNQPSDRETFEQVKKWVKRGWTKKALEHLAEWDYGHENIDTARANGTIRNTILDDREHGDRIIKEQDGYFLCEASCPSGLYEAYYLVRGILAEGLPYFTENE